MNYIDELLMQVRNEELVNELLPDKPNKVSSLVKCASEEDKSKKVYNYLKPNYPSETLQWVKGAKWSLKDIPLSDIKMARRPGGAREQDKVKGIAEAVENGEPMEAVVLVKTPNSSKYKIADGYHRTLGFEKAKKDMIKAWVGEVEENNGPWDKEMHEKKLNVGKTAFEELSFLEKEAAAPVLAGLGRLGAGLVRGTFNAGKSLSGYNVAKATANKRKVLKNPKSTRADIRAAKRQQAKSVAGTAGSWGAIGTAGYAGGVADKYNEQRKQQIQHFDNQQQMQQIQQGIQQIQPRTNFTYR